MPIHRYFLALFFLFQFCPPLHSQVLQNKYGRNVRSLNGQWNYIIDPYETGYYNFHGEAYQSSNPGASAAFFNNYKAKNKQELVEYDFDKSPAMSIPGDWNTQSAQLLYYEGTVWFMKRFDYTLQKGRRLFLSFGAVNYKAMVFLNGQKIGEHEGGFTPFQFEVTDFVHERNNSLVVKVDNRRSASGVPALTTDWWNYGGITRDVLLIDEPSAYIDDYLIQSDPLDPATVKGFIRLAGSASPMPVVVSIPELKLTKELRTADTGMIHFEFSLPAYTQNWTPENPKRYTVSIRTPYQVLYDKIGFRTIQVKGPDMLLNGKPILLKGICLHEEIAGRRAVSEQDALLLLRTAKQLNCNYVRLAHYPHNEFMVRVADSLGLLVWEEVPVYWSIDFSNPAVLQNTKIQLSEVIARDKNRAAVIIWSVANETPLSAARNNFLRELVKHVRHADNTRLVSAALLTRQLRDTSYVDDEIGANLDVVAFNQYRGWYGGDLANAPNAIWKTIYNKPLVVSEFGGDARQGLHGPMEDRWTEEFQAYLYRQNLKMIQQMPNIRGISPWILMDFRSPRRLLPGIQDGFNRKGLVSEKNVRKKAFFVLQDFYRQWNLP